MRREGGKKPVDQSTTGTLSDPPETPDPVPFSRPDGERLDSWKEIAAFVKRDERTAMRWAKEQGMPVRRAPGSRRARVYASRAELTRWLTERQESTVPAQIPVPPPPRFTKWFVAAGILLGVIVLSIGVTVLKLKLPKYAHLPADARFNEQSLIVLDSDGHKLWSHTFERKLNLVLDNPPSHFAWVADLLDNGGREVIAVVPSALGPNEKDGTEFEITCFSDRGNSLWSYTPRETFRFGVHELHGPWKVLDLIVSKRKSSTVIYVALVHDAWGNSFVAQLDPTTGHSTVRYVNTGTIRSLGEVQADGGTYLIAAGFNNEFEAGSAALIDERKPFAASPQSEGTRHKCVSCPEGAPDYYLVFPQSEGNLAMKYYENAVQGIKVNGSEVQFGKYESGGGIDDVYYLFGLRPHIHPISLRYSSAYDLQHRELERSGKLHHSLETCPERLRPRPVRMWTPAAGWTELQFGPRGFDQ
jgi:hypothetical protein